MRADPRFLAQPRHFWANVRSISEQVGYTVRGEGVIRIPTIEETAKAYDAIGLSAAHIAVNGKATDLGQRLFDYFAFRAKILNEYVEPRLMDAERAEQEFASLASKSKWACPQPMNKQSGDKRAPAFFTCIINMLIEANSGGLPCDFDPRVLTAFTADGMPLRTLARRVDGAFPSAVDPAAVWEIKEYYYTTSFGSRIADGVYETLLDGMELQELEQSEGIRVDHLLMVDAYYTWWTCGKSYLCRIVDMLHMGYVDEVLFGYEVIERLPDIVKGWVQKAIT